MKSVGGNILCKFYNKREGALNEIGEPILKWQEYARVYGWLDYISGVADRGYKLKLEDSTHIFICNYFKLPKDEAELKGEIFGTMYEVLKIDNVMEMNEHYEIYLKQVGE